MKTKSMKITHRQPYGHHDVHARYFKITALAAIVVGIILIIIFYLLLRSAFN